MNKPVVLTLRAVSDLIKITSFNTELYGVEKAEKITEAIFSQMEILENLEFDFINIGAVDDDFKHLKRDYKKLIKGHYKITYREGKSKIYINRIFDTRQHPSKNK